VEGFEPGVVRIIANPQKTTIPVLLIYLTHPSEIIDEKNLQRGSTIFSISMERQNH
jgi:hypothetical protein